MDRSDETDTVRHTGGIVEKALFSITCTTCQARLIVRSEAAIGTILECPKCQSMVHVMPPEGWAPPSPAGEEQPLAAAGSPPPLHRVRKGARRWNSISPRQPRPPRRRDPFGSSAERPSG